MGESVGSRLKHAWNAFMNRAPTVNYYGGNSYRPGRRRFSRGVDRSIVTSVYHRISMDAASVKIQHVQLDEDERFVDEIQSGLNDCLSIEANIDQSGRSLIQDAVMSMLDEGCIALVPIDTDDEPEITADYDILTIRTGKIVDRFPQYVRVNVYNESTGEREDLIMPKRDVAILENPFYSVMNEPNSTLQRLVRKLNLLDAVDEQSSSGKLDLIIQLPYVIKSEARRKQAEQRRKDIEDQLAGSKYGIAYTDGTERVVQLNRPVENNLMSQIEYLTSMLFSQLGITQGILDGSADEKTIPYIQDLGIVVQGWYPLGGWGHTAKLLGDKVISAIAENHGVSSAQVILRWNLQKRVAVILGSSNPDHIKENTELYGFALTDVEMAQINALDRNEKHDWY